MKIAHYTKIHAFKSILKSRVLKASHYSTLNDVAEIKIAIERIRRQFRSISQRDAFDNNFFPALGDDFYITSFSLHESDNNGLLSMWRAYAGQDGCAIIFDYHKYDNHLRDKIGFEECQICTVFEPVEYDRETVKWNSIFQKFENNIDVFLSKRKVDNSTIENLMNLLLLLKHSGFQEEKEVRVGVLRNLPAPPGVQNLIKKPLGCENKQVDFPFYFDLVEKIIVSPGQKQEENYQRLCNIKKEINELSRVEIVKSDIPFIWSK